MSSSSFFWRLGAFNALVLAVWGLMYAHVLNFPAKWFYEQGPIEISSVVTLMLGAIMMFLHPFATRHAKLALGWLLSIMAMRELDMDKALTYDSVFKAKFYMGAAPLHEKVLGVALIIGTLWVLWRACQYLPVLFRKFWQGDHLAWLVCFGIGYIVIGRFIDTMHRTAPWVANHILTDSPVNMQLEESFEHLGYITMLFAVIYSWRVMTDKALHQSGRTAVKVGLPTQAKKKAKRNK